MRLKTTDLRLPGDPNRLIQQLQELISRTNQQVNGISEGTGSSFHAARATIPTTGTWASGDFVKKTTYADTDGGIAGYTTIGWLRITDGSANVLGTDWLEAQVPTGGYGWRDLVGYPVIQTVGANDPLWDTYRGTIKQYKFSNVATNEMWFSYHIDHDHKAGSEMYIHAHWSQIVVDSGGTAGAPGDVKWYFDVSYAKGHQQAPFAAPITTSVVQTASGTQYTHMIAEVQLTATSPSASQIDSDIIETDGLLLVRIYRDPTDPADTLNQNPFLHTCDLHYQSDHVTTPNRGFPFF